MLLLSVHSLLSQSSHLLLDVSLIFVNISETCLAVSQYTTLYGLNIVYLLIPGCNIHMLVFRSYQNILILRIFPMLKKMSVLVWRAGHVIVSNTFFLLPFKTDTFCSISIIFMIQQSRFVTDSSFMC